MIKNFIRCFKETPLKDWLAFGIQFICAIGVISLLVLVASFAGSF